MIDVHGLAERLDITESFVRRLVLERRIPFYKMGRLVRFDADEIDEWIAQSRVDPVSSR